MKTLKIEKFESSQLSDFAVIQRILAGEKELYEILLKRYNQTLYRTIRSYVRDDETEDLMQDTYIKAFEKLNQFKGDASFSTWLIRIGINETLQRIRIKKRHLIINLYENGDVSHKIKNIPTSNSMNPEKQIINNENRLIMEKAIDHLPEKYRIVYVLREVEGMNNSKVASCLNISESNVKVRLHRAKALLKEMLFKLSSNTEIFEFGDRRCDRVVKNVMRCISNLPSN